MDDTRHTNVRGGLDLAAVLRRRIVVVIACALLVPAAALVASLLQPTQYSAEASLLFQDPGFDQTLFGTEVASGQDDADRTAATNLRLISLGVVADRAERRLAGRVRLEESLDDTLEFTSENETDIVTVTATYRDGPGAALIANVFAEEYIRFRREAERAKIRDAGQLIEERSREVGGGGAQGAAAYSQQAELLETLAALQTGNAELVQRADVPSDPSSPQPLRNTLLAAGLGLLIALAVALLVDRVDRRLRDPGEVSETFDRPVLGLVPDSRALRAENRAEGTLPPRETEVFRLLRANLRYFNVSSEVKSVLVTSASPEDGKTTVARYLATAAAETGSRVILVEADLRAPTLRPALGLDTRDDAGNLLPGLSEVLAAAVRLDHAVQSIPVSYGANGTKQRHSLDVLSAGAIPPNPGDLIESDRMRALIELLTGTYDLVVIDTPPTSVVSDAIPLLREVDGVIVVSRLGKTTRDAAQRLRYQLENLQAPTLGVVINGSTASAEGYAYYGEQP